MKDTIRVNNPNTIMHHTEWRSAMKSIIRTGLAAVVLLAGFVSIYAGPLTGGAATLASELKVFVAGDPARAADVNDNFALVKAAVNDNNTRIGVLEAVGADITGVTAGTGLTGGGTSGTVTLSLATGGVTSTHIADGTIGTVDIANAAVTGTKIASGTITAANIASGTITAANIASGTITAANIATGAVTTTQILDGTITTADLANSAVTAAKILDEPGVDWTGISRSNVYVRGAATSLASVALTVPASGYVIVRFDGLCYPSTGDTIVLAASNAVSWGVNDGNISVYGYSGQTNGTPFSHTRVYSVGSAGTYYYYAVAQNYVNQGGTGYTSVYGTLTATYVPTRY